LVELSNMKIRKASLKDVKSISELNRKFFRERERNWEELISGKDSEMFVLELNKRIVGFTGVFYRKWNNAAQIINIFIRPDYRNKGYGTKLLKFMTQYLKNKKYRTLMAEAPSLNPVLMLYLKNGFRVCGFNDRYYSNRAKDIAIFLSYDFK